MDYGKLTDHNGKTADFRNVILIMTTNAGAVDLAKAAVGFVRENRSGEDFDAINRTFTPEFRNRLDAIIGFTTLPSKVISQVVDKFIMQLEEQLADRKVTIVLSGTARSWLAKRGYDPSFGARPLTRLIQEKIKKPLAEELLFGKLKNGGTVRIGVKAKQLTFSYTKHLNETSNISESKNKGKLTQLRKKKISAYTLGFPGSWYCCLY